MTNKLLRTGDLTQLLGISRSSIRNWTKTGQFPKPIKLGPRAIGWWSDEIEAWIENRSNQPLSSQEDQS